MISMCLATSVLCINQLEISIDIQPRPAYISSCIQSISHRSIAIVTMRPTVPSLARLARLKQSSVVTLPVSATRAASSQAGPSTPSPSSSTSRPKQKRLPKAVLRDLVNLHHRSSTFMHDPAQLTDAFQVAFRTAPPEKIHYDEFRKAAMTTGAVAASGYARPSTLTTEYDRPEASFKRPGEDVKWSDGGAMDMADGHLTEREKLVREALFGTHERGPGEQVRPALEGVEEWLAKEGRSVEETARDWDDRHNDVPTSSGQQRREAEDGQ